MQSCQLECRRGIRGENDVPPKLSPRLVFTAWSLSFRICQLFSNFCGIRMWWRLVEAQVLSAWSLCLIRGEAESLPFGQVPRWHWLCWTGTRCRTAATYAHGRKTSTLLITGCSALSVPDSAPVALTHTAVPQGASYSVVLVHPHLFAIRGTWVVTSFYCYDSDASGILASLWVLFCAELSVRQLLEADCW